MMSGYAVPAATGGVAAFLAWAAYRTWPRPGAGALHASPQPPPKGARVSVPGLLGAAAGRTPAWALSAAERVCSAIPASWLNRLDRLAGAAGLHPAPAASDILLACTIGAALGSAAGGIVVAGVRVVAEAAFAGSALTTLLTWVAPLACAAAGAAQPLYSLASARARRRSDFSRELPETLDLLVVCAEAGLGLSQAIRAVAAAAPGVMGAELRRAVQEMDAGLPASSAMRQMARRCHMPALSALAAALAQNERLGTPIAEILRHQSEAARASRRQELEQHIDTLPTRLTLCAIFLLLPPVFVVTVLPSLLSFAAAWR